MWSGVDNALRNAAYYRLDPPPFQLPTTQQATSAADAELATHFAEASKLFLDTYQFFVREYSDSNDILERPPNMPADVPTDIDSPDGHFIIHPDYSDYVRGGPDAGRLAHVNHIHAQLGPTRYAAMRRR